MMGRFDDGFRMTRRSLMGSLGVSLLLYGGCSTPQRSSHQIGTRRVVASEPRNVFDAAELALIDAGYQIERRDFAEGVLSTRPIAVDRRGEPTPGVRISSRNRLRRVAEVRIRQTGKQVEAGCTVLVQEQTTNMHRLFAGQQSANDTFNDTPIDRDAATTSSQNTVWRTIRRDRVAERAILAGISARSGGGAPPAAPR